MKLSLSAFLRLLPLGFLFLSSCLYSVPDKEHIRTIPTTNNPQMIKDKSNYSNPGISY